MHISEGVLSAPILGAGWAIAAAGTALGLRGGNESRLMTVALLASAFFLATLIHVPIGPTSVHLVLNGLLGAVLGVAAFPAILVGLLLQSILFQYGGLTALGVNAMNMALPAALLGAALRGQLTGGSRSRRAAAAFFIGAGAVALSACLTALSLALSGDSFHAAAKLLLLGHLPIMGIEGLGTLFIVSFIAKVRPEILAMSGGIAQPGAATET